MLFRSTVMCSAAAIQFVRGSDLVITAPAYTTRAMAEDFGLAVLPMPLDLPPSPIYLSWHQRHDTDAAHAWLRRLAKEALVGATWEAGEDFSREPVVIRPSRPS